MVLMVIFRLIIVVVFVYLSWKKLRQEYRSNDIFLFLWSTILMFLVGGRVVYGFIHFGEWGSWLDWILIWRVGGITYWAGLLSVLFWTGYFCYLKKWKFLNLAEEMTSFGIFFLWGMILAEYLFNGVTLFNLGWVMIGAVLLCQSLIMTNIYRSFVWYSSGKKGFVLWSTLALMGFLSAVWLGVMKSPWWLVIGPLIFGLTSFVELLILGDTFKNLMVKKGRVKNER